jgi:ribosomal protein S18 acetylase RimI-like enzyme
LTRAETAGEQIPGCGSFFVLTPGDRRSAGLFLKNLEAGGGEAVFVGLGRSMEPVLLPGDQVRIVKVTGRLRAGWVVVFSWRGGIVTHRVIRVAGSVFWARGDSCADIEGPVPFGDAIGRVVAYNRDGRWYSLEGASSEALGLVINFLNSGVRKAARRWPQLRRVIETDLPGILATLGISRALGRWVYGDVRVVLERRPERVIGALVSGELPLTQELVKKAEGLIARGNLKLFVARSSNRGRIGRLLLYRTDPESGFVFSFLVSIGARGMGVGGMLLDAAEEVARSDGMLKLVALVTPGDGSTIREFQSAGFHALINGHVESGMLLPKGKAFFEKEL